MKITADVASLISAERMVVAEHEFSGQVRKITFPLSLYKKTHFSQDNETFQSINEYWASLPYDTQGKIYEIYEDIRELFDSVTGNTELKEELKRLIKRLMDYHKTKDMVRWIKRDSKLVVPISITRNYVFDVDKNTTEDKTYVIEDYIGLMGLSVIFRAMIPIWAMFNKPAKDEIGKILKDMHSFLLLADSEVFKSEDLARLQRYITANINKETHTGNHTLEFIVTDNMPFYLLSMVCMRKLCIGDLYSENPKQNLAALVYTYIIDRPGPHGGDHSQQVRSKKIKKEGAGETSENSGSTLEIYKARATITPGRMAEMEYALRDPVNLAIQLCPDSDPAKVALDCTRALQTSVDMLDKGIEIPQVILAQWVISPVFPAQGVLYMEQDIIVKLCAITEAVLRNRGYGYLALLSTSVAMVDENANTVRLTPIGSKSQINEELSKALEVNYPFKRVPKKKTATNTNHDFVQEDIKRLASEFSRYTWRATADQKLVTEVLGTHVRRVGILPQLRADIGYMLVNAEELFN